MTFCFKSYSVCAFIIFELSVLFISANFIFRSRVSVLLLFSEHSVHTAMIEFGDLDVRDSNALNVNCLSIKSVTN